MILLHVNLCLGFWEVSKSALFMKMESACTLVMQSHLLQIVLTSECACVCAHVCRWIHTIRSDVEISTFVSLGYMSRNWRRITESDKHGICFPSLSENFWNGILFYYFLMLILERERERAQVGEGQREGDRGSRVVSALTTESLMQGSNSPTSRSWPELKSDA